MPSNEARRGSFVKPPPLNPLRITPDGNLNVGGRGELCPETLKNEVPKPRDLLDLVGRTFLSRGSFSNFLIFVMFFFLVGFSRFGTTLGRF